MTTFDTTETDNTILIGNAWNGLYRDRYGYDRDTILYESIMAWRLNPLARRLANLYKVYNVDGIAFKCEHEATQKFLMQFWNHDLNNMKRKLEKISNEIFLTGNLFTVYSTDASGMSYFRIFPTDQIAEIVTAGNDVEQEIEYITKEISMDVQAQTFKHPRGLTVTQQSVVMRHDTVNQLAGTSWGEGEIWPDLPWLSRYATWLEDRVRLNHFRSAFMYVVQGQFKSDADKRKRQAELNSNPPRPGTVLVTDPSEQWGIMSANLDAFDASMDGMAIKRMIAVNHVPMHYLAEPESSTTTTADAAGTPTFKGFENHQETFKEIVEDILKTVLRRRAEKDSSVKADAEIIVTSADATERDNAALALATSQIVSSIAEIYDRELIDEQEYLRLIYRFSGEIEPKGIDKVKGIRRVINAPKPTTPTNGNGYKPANAAGAIKIDTASGDVKIKEPR
jgi:hypothetical protein